MVKQYRYTVDGTARGDQTWTVTGLVSGELSDIYEQVLSETFLQLTEGKAVFGSPGDTCQGPYNVKKILIEQSAT